MLIALLALLGLVIGCVGTLIGAGGGFLLMPILLIWRPDDPPDRLTALSLTMVFFNALSGAIGYARMKRIDYRAGLVFAAAALPGAAAGAWLIELVPRHGFDAGLAIFLAMVSVFLLWRGERRHTNSTGAGGQKTDEPHARPLLGAGAAVSVFVGCISSIAGIGGGIIHVPALNHLARFPIHIAAATSHFVLAITSCVAVIVLASRGMLSGQMDQAAALACGAVVGAQFGTRLSSRVHGSFIVRLLAVALLLAAARVGWQALHSKA